MDRFAGVSDFRFIGGVAGLSTLEHAGLLASLANFTVLPGAFSWHVKALLLRGQYPHEGFHLKLAMDVLSLTWFFSSLYLVYLYLALFLKPARGSSRSGVHSMAPAARRGGAVAGVWAVSQVLLAPATLAPTSYFSRELATACVRSMSSSFFLLLLLSLLVLICGAGGSYYTYVDMGWVGDTFAWVGFTVVDFYR